MSESNVDDCSRRVMAEAIKRLLVDFCSAGLVGGDRAKAYLVTLGLPDNAVFLGYDAVDNLYFEANAERVRRDQTMPELEYGQILDPCWRGRYFLASARFVEKKNLPRLIEAYARYRATRHADDAWPLVILGDGVLRDHLEEMRRTLRLEGAVHMPGFRQYGELPKYYGSAGAFVHASTTEQWGLVVNEAMASGLAVAVSNRCGCAETLVEDGRNGVLFDPYDVHAIASALARITDYPQLWEFGSASRSIIASWGPERFGEELSRAAQTAIARGFKRAGPARRALLRLAAAFQGRPRDRNFSPIGS
jgi:glycosyltransferase involved in cell wall biosynthesis